MFVSYFQSKLYQFFFPPLDKYICHVSWKSRLLSSSEIECLLWFAWLLLVVYIFF